jgi:hypothetical protein
VQINQFPKENGISGLPLPKLHPHTPVKNEINIKAFTTHKPINEHRTL